MELVPAGTRGEKSKTGGVGEIIHQITDDQVFP
jgi:hypothetical protein